MFSLSLFASFLVLGMLFASPLATAFRNYNHKSFMSALRHDATKNHVKAIRVSDVVRTLQGMPCVPSEMVQTMPMRKICVSDPSVMVDAGIRCD